MACFKWFMSPYLEFEACEYALAIISLRWFLYFGTNNNIQLRPSEEVNIHKALGGNNPSGVDNFGYSPIQRAVTVLLYRTNSWNILFNILIVKVLFHWGYSLDVVIFEGYSPLNNRVIQWTCVILEVIHPWRRLEA